VFTLTKLLRHGFEQSCSGMVAQKLEGKVQQHDGDAESSKTGCRNLSKAHGRADAQTPALFCDSSESCAQLLFEEAILIHLSKITHPNIWGRNVELLQMRKLLHSSAAALTAASWRSCNLGRPFCSI